MMPAYLATNTDENTDCSISSSANLYGKAMVGNPRGRKVFLTAARRINVWSRSASNRLVEDGSRTTSLKSPSTAFCPSFAKSSTAVSYTHLRAHETVLDLVCRLLL